MHNSVELPQQRFQNSSAINSEVAKGLGCTNCFADDTNAACRQKAASIRAIRDILVEFAGISGLNCNIEKTCINIIQQINICYSKHLIIWFCPPPRGPLGGKTINIDPETTPNTHPTHPPNSHKMFRGMGGSPIGNVMCNS